MPPLCVCLKPVWRTDVPLRLEPASHGPRTEEAPLDAGPADGAALQLALRLREEVPGLRVLALSVGPPAAEPTLREALAAGADEALRVWGAHWPPRSGDVDGSGDATQTLAIAAAEALRPRRPMLVLAGEQSSDTSHECFAAFLAGALQADFAHRVTRLRYEPDGWHALVLLERGYGQPLMLRAPAVATVSAQLPRPGYAALPAWLSSLRAEVPLANVASAGPLPALTHLRVPRPRVKAQPLPGRGLGADERIHAMVTLEAGGGGALLASEPPELQADALLALLRERGYLPR